MFTSEPDCVTEVDVGQLNDWESSGNEKLALPEYLPVTFGIVLLGSLGLPPPHETIKTSPARHAAYLRILALQ
jgi:hypothetical protein